jgi:hypothetical protein
MSDDEKTLNQQNHLSTGAYIVINILVFLILKLGVSANEATDSILEKFLTSATWLLISGIFTKVINGQLSSQVKAVLVFWRIKETLPGCRAFSYFMDRDPRINPNVLQAKFGNLPSHPTEQNRLWYKIYKKHELKKSVEDAHKKFLLTRDLASLSFLGFGILAISGYFMFANFSTWMIYTSALLVTFLITSQAARNYGIKLVSNVLAEESSI